MSFTTCVNRKEGCLDFEIRSPIDYNALNSVRPGSGDRLERLLQSNINLGVTSLEDLDKSECYNAWESVCIAFSILTLGLGLLCALPAIRFLKSRKQYDATDEQRDRELLVTRLLETGLRPTDFTIVDDQIWWLVRINLPSSDEAAATRQQREALEQEERELQSMVEV
jgi:hypothetical protein